MVVCGRVGRRGHWVHPAAYSLGTNIVWEFLGNSGRDGQHGCVGQDASLPFLREVSVWVVNEQTDPQLGGSIALWPHLMEQ